MIPVIKNNKEKIIKKLESLMGDEGQNFETPEHPDYVLGLRGIYKDELGKRFLNPSFSEVESYDTESLPGTSVVEISQDVRFGLKDELEMYLDEALSIVKDYGDTKYFAVVIGKDLGPDVEKNDYLENVLGDAEVVAYIER